MAQNPRWCQPLSAWERRFSDWILKEAFKRIERFQARARFDFIGIPVTP